MATKNLIGIDNPTALFQFGPGTQKLIFALAGAFCLSPFASPSIALLLGVSVAQLSGNPFLKLNHKATHYLLQISVVGLGFSMNAHSAIEAGQKGIVLTSVFICGALLLGYLLATGLKIESKTAYLISAGTAICGGSAIAAIAPVIKAGEKQVSVALGCIFILNSVALFVFPPLGHYFHLSQTQFGLWCAIAIHDTSSVVGAAAKYGAHALEVATTVKLTRALWIVPVAVISSLLFKSDLKTVKVPYFIGLFVIAMVLNTWLPFKSLYCVFIHGAQSGLVLTLFLIGAGISPAVLKTVGVKPFLLSIVLWVVISGVGLFTVMVLGK